MVFGGEPSAFVREHFHALKKDVVGHLDGRAGRGARRAGGVGGWLQIAPSGRRSRTGSTPSRRRSSRRAGLAGGRLELCARRARRARHLRRLVDLRRAARRRCRATRAVQRRARAQVLLRRGCTTLVFYRPAVALAHALRPAGRGAARRRLDPGVAATASATLGRDSRRSRPGSSALYVLAFAAGVAVLAIVFVAVR